MQLKELCEYQNQVRVDTEGEKEKNSRPSLDRKDKYRESRGPRFTRYTSLNANREKIMNEALKVDFLPTPQKVLSPKDVDLT